MVGVSPLIVFMMRCKSLSNFNLWDTDRILKKLPLNHKCFILITLIKTNKELDIRTFKHQKLKNVGVIFMFEVFKINT